MISRLLRIRKTSGKQYEYSFYRIAAIVALLAFLFLTGLTAFHHHADPKEADECLICQWICLTNNALPVAAIVIIFAVLFFFLAQTKYFFIYQPYLTYCSERAPPYLTS
jgi:hypothetical protein